MIKIDTSRADYLKAIYSCMEKEGSASNKRITDLLEVSPSSVTEMIRRLVEAGDVYLDKKEIYLTEQGMVEVKEILTKHRLWEIFLVRYLNYSWYEVHEEADALEHATSDRLKDRLNELLNHPEHCPHGSEIFENHKYKDMLRLLSDLKPGDETSVHRVADDKELLESVVRNFKESNPTSDIVAEKFKGRFKQDISKSPKQDEEKQIYQIYADFTASRISRPPQ